jgi:signal transduction histidine kinase
MADGRSNGSVYRKNNVLNAGKSNQTTGMECSGIREIGYLFRYTPEKNWAIDFISDREIFYNLSGKKINSHWLDFIHPEDQELYSNQTTPQNFSVFPIKFQQKYRLRTADGTIHQAEDKGWMRFCEKEQTYLLQGTIQIGQKSNQFELENLLISIYQDHNVPTFFTDLKGNIIYANLPLVQLTGYSLQELIGASVDAIFIATGNKALELPVETNAGIRILKRQDDISIQIILVEHTIRDNTSHPCYLLYQGVISKSSAEYNTEKDEKIQLIQEIANIGFLELDLSQRIFYSTTETFVKLGFSKFTRYLTIRDFLIQVEPEDYALVDENLKKLIKGLKSLDVEFGFVSKTTGKKMKLQFKAPNRDTSKNRILGIIQDITKIKTAEDELKVRNFELNNFVYKVSHDIRAPLVSIEGLVNLMRMSHQENGSSVYLELIYNSIRKLDHFVRNVLSHSKNLNIEIAISKIDLHHVIRKSREQLYYLEKESEIRQILEVKGEALYSDEERLIEVFKNLISNSILYRNPGKPNPYFKIKMEVYASHAFIEFSDNGEGIEESIRGKIFDMFYRGNERSRGSGIGLYIVKQALHKISGEIKLESKMYEGATFKIKIPNLRRPFLNKNALNSVKISDPGIN